MCDAQRLPPRRVAHRSIVAAAEAATRASAATAGTSTTAPTGLTFLGLADVDLPTADIAAVQLLDRLAGFDRRAHFDESEPARAAALAIVHDGRRFHGSRRCEQ